MAVHLIRPDKRTYPELFNYACVGCGAKAKVTAGVGHSVGSSIFIPHKETCPRLNFIVSRFPKLALAIQMGLEDAGVST